MPSVLKRGGKCARVPTASARLAQADTPAPIRTQAMSVRCCPRDSHDRAVAALPGAPSLASVLSRLSCQTRRPRRSTKSCGTWQPADPVGDAAAFQVLREAQSHNWPSFFLCVTADRKQVGTRAFIVMAAEGPPSTPFADSSTARRGWWAPGPSPGTGFAHHDDGATTARPNLPAVCCNIYTPATTLSPTGRHLTGPLPRRQIAAGVSSPRTLRLTGRF